MNRIKTKNNAGARCVNLVRKNRLSSAIALILASSSTAVHAAAIDVGNTDFNVRWDNTVRYNAGWRMEKENDTFSRSQAYDDTEHKFQRGDMVTNRLDLISELDVVYKNAYGFRVSGAAWYDHAYQDSAEPNTDIAGSSGNFYNNHYNSYTTRYISGPSGEILDAFVFGNFNLGSMSANVKVGQHNVYWGESLYSIGNSIAYSQGPVDTIKSATSPGAEAKELFLPLKQISTTIQLTDELALSAQYLLDWEPFRLVPGGTYFAGSDGARSDLGNTAAGGLEVSNGDDLEPDDKKGDFGVSLRWSPWWLEGTAGVYYRKFDEKLPWSFQQLAPSGFPPPFPAALPTDIRLAYARDTELYGVSFSKNIGTVSIGSEVSFRKNTALNSAAGYAVLGANSANPTYSEAEGARGDTWHALVNAIYLLPRTFLWEGGTLQGEITYNHLDKITENEGRYNGLGYGCVGPNAANPVWKDSCADDHSLGAQIGFTPEWPQLFPGWDVSMPVTLAYGIDGNSPTPGGTNEDAYNYSIGIAGKLRNTHTLTLRWVDSHAEYKTTNTGLAASQYTNGSAVQNDHGWISFSYKATF